MMPVPKSRSDVDMARGWAPDIILSLMEVDEFARLADPCFQTTFADKLWQLPIVDFGVPSKDQAAKCEQVLTQARGVLYKKGRVLIHCHGGCGRTGMIALRMMIDQGEALDVALKRLRIARPCAIETDAQMAWSCKKGER